jgi:hypothetical protein
MLISEKKERRDHYSVGRNGGNVKVDVLIVQALLRRRALSLPAQSVPVSAPAEYSWARLRTGVAAATGGACAEACIFSKVRLQGLAMRRRSPLSIFNRASS